MIQLVALRQPAPLLLIFVYRHNSILEVYSRAGLVGRRRISVVLLFPGEENIAYSQQTKPFLQDNLAHNRLGEYCVDRDGTLPWYVQICMCSCA
jgi:hypothetical protein